MLHRLRNYMLYPLIALATGIMLLMAVGVAYEDEVKARLITAVNAHLNAPVSVQDIDLTLIRRFPNASLHLHNVLVQEAYPGSTLADTLLHARDLYLEFALFDLFGGSYTIDHIHADRVVAYPRHNADGLANYTIWGSDSTAETTAIDLRMISFEDLFLRYRHEGNVLDLKFHAQSLALSGSFSGSLNTLHAAGDVELLDWSQHGSSLLAQRRTEVDLHMDLGAGDAPFRITNGEVKADGMSLTTTLSVSPDDRGTHIDLRAAGDRIELETLFAQLPRSLTDPLKRYGMAGESDVVIHYSGTIGEGLRPTLQVDLALRAARFSEQGSGTTFKGVHGWLEATINGQGDLEKLVIRELKASTGSGSLKADLELRAGSKGSIKGGLKADLAFGDLLRFAQIDTLEQAEGRLRADLKFDGPFSEPGRYGVREMRQLRLSGTATLDKAAIKMKGIRHRVTDLHAELVLNGADVRLVGMHADVQGSRIALEGSLRNLVPYVLVEQERLEIEAAASSDHIDLAAWLAHDTDGDGGSYALSLPKGIGMDLRVDVKELAFEDFRGRNIAGHVMMRNGILRAEPVSFNTASGQVKGSLVLDGSVSSPFALRIDADLSEISVRELFTEFRNFGQDFIRSEQLAGVARSQVRFEAPLSPTLSLDLDRLRCTIDLRIDKGNLKGHAPLMAVADHVQGNKLIAPFVDTRALRDRLADVQFASLENRIEIRDRQVIIPLMEVKSSVMDIELSGQHGFDDVIDHHVNFRLGELLRNGPLEDEFGPIVDDGTGVRVFLHMFGPADDPSFETDNAMASARRQQQWRNEKQVLGDLFKEEFGGDRDKQAILKDPRNTRFQVEWGDSSLTNAQQPPTPKRKDRDEDPKVTFEIED